MTVNPVYMSWATRALEAYGLTDAALAYLGHNENLTFRVADPRNGSAYLLRLHRPVSAAFVGMRQRPDVIASECAWLEAIARDTPLAVQAPVRSLSGESVSHVASDDDSIPASLLRWLDGQPFRRDAPDADEHATALGTLVARLHDHAAHWTPPEGFARPAYDLAYYRDQLSTSPRLRGARHRLSGRAGYAAAHGGRDSGSRRVARGESRVVGPDSRRPARRQSAPPQRRVARD